MNASSDSLLVTAPESGGDRTFGWRSRPVIEVVRYWNIPPEQRP